MCGGADCSRVPKGIEPPDLGCYQSEALLTGCSLGREQAFIEPVSVARCKCLITGNLQGTTPGPARFGPGSSLVDT